MIGPSWLRRDTQPIGIDATIQYLLRAPEVPESEGREVQIGGPDLLPPTGDAGSDGAGDGKAAAAKAPVPFTTPGRRQFGCLVTPVDVKEARPLVEGLTTATVVTDPSGAEPFDISPESFDEALRRGARGGKGLTALLAAGCLVPENVARMSLKPAPEAGLQRGSQDSNLESPVLETGALANLATAPRLRIVTVTGLNGVRAEGLEPPRAEAHQDLNLARMPIPPRPRGCPEGLTRDQCRTVAHRFYDRLVAIGEVRPGYELWRPNREKAESVTAKFVIVLLLAATAAIAALVTITGFSVLSGGSGMGIICLIYALLYAFFAYRVARWSRGTLPVAAALSMILAIFCAVGANSWFARDKAGFTHTAIPVTVIGTLVVILALLQIVLIAAALYGFNQGWNVEEERPIGSGEDYGAGASPE